jgi:hypothetical protein
VTCKSDDDCKIEGRWWIHGQNARPEFGIFSRDDDGRLSLVVKIPQSLSVDETALQFFDTYDHGSIPTVIFGRDADDKPVTLFGCYASRGSSTGMRRYNIHVLAGVQGIELESWSQECIHAVNLDIDFLHEWLGGKIVETVKTPDGRALLQIPHESDLVIEVSAGVQLRIVRFIAPSSSVDGYNLRPRHQLWLHFHSAETVCHVCDWWVPWITRLMSLLVGDPVTCSKTELFVQDPYAADVKEFVNPGTVIRPGNNGRAKPKNIHPFAMPASYASVGSDFQKIVQNWFRVASQLEPVVDLFSTVAFHNYLHSEAEFLFLVQAFEVYHARVFGGSSKHLDERFVEIFERHSPEARRLFPNIAELPEKIQYTRNHLTHYSKDPNSPKYLRPADMVEISWYLRVFMWVCLLKEIGVAGQSIERLIRRRGDAHFVNLQ